MKLHKISKEICLFLFQISIDILLYTWYNNNSGGDTINKVQEYRKEQGYTQFELAQVSKVSFNTIQKLESAKGINSDAYVSVALKLAKALGTTVEELFKFE